MDGISSIETNLLNEERKLVLNTITQNRMDLLKHHSKEEKREWIKSRLEFKLKSAMKKKPLSRDWKVIRNGVKFFFKDLFITLHP